MPQTVPWPTKDQRCLPWCVVFIEKNPVMVIFFMKSIQINWNHGVFFLPLESYACLTLCRDVISAVLGMITTRLQLRSCGDAVPNGDGLDVWQKWLQTCPMIRNGMWLSAHMTSWYTVFPWILTQTTSNDSCFLVLDQRPRWHHRTCTNARSTNMHRAGRHNYGARHRSDDLCLNLVGPYPPKLTI